MQHHTRFLTATTLAVVLVVAACGGEEDSAIDDTSTTVPSTTTSHTPATTTAVPLTTTTVPPERLVVWSDSARSAPITEIAARFTADTGIAVDVVEKDFAAIRADATQGIIGGEGPDIFLGAHDWTGALVAADVVTRLDDMPTTTRSDFFAAPFTGFTVAGSTYGLPYQFEAVAMWMNTTLAGVTEAPADFEVLRSMCDRVVDEQRGQVCLSVPGGADSVDAYHQFPFTSAFGGSIFSFDPDFGYIANDAGIDSAQSIAGNTFMEALAIEEYMPSFDYGSAEAAFAEGRAMFWMTGPWARDIVVLGSADSGFAYQAVPIPLMDDNVARPFVEARGFFVSNGSTLEETAKQFLYDYVATAASMSLLYAADSPLPTHQAVAASIEDPLLEVFIASAAGGQPTPNLPAMTDTVWEAWGESLAKIRNRTAAVDAALRAGAARINAELDN